jgi:hypothetical protein
MDAQTMNAISEAMRNYSQLVFIKTIYETNDQDELVKTVTLEVRRDNAGEFMIKSIATMNPNTNLLELSEGDIYFPFSEHKIHNIITQAIIKTFEARNASK